MSGERWARATTRREFVGRGAAAIAAALGCFGPEREGAEMRRGEGDAARRAAANGRLTARPGTPTAPPQPGLAPLGLAAERDALLYVPPSVRPDRPAPLAVMLHGAGGAAERALAILRPLADAAGLLLLAPPSRDETWDVIRNGYGPDVAFVDAALERVFARHAVDPGRLAVGGFSDGASYALSLGLTNGDLFSHVIAFSPGFMVPAREVGRPRCYLSHGTRDAVLPIDRCSRRLVPALERAGYAVRYREFDGPHTVPAAIASEAVEWFVTG